MTLKAATDPLRSKILVTGKGEHLQLPGPPFIGAVTVQLVNTDLGICWSSTFSVPVRNNAGRYAAHSD